jgi:hypothetical protein
VLIAFVPTQVPLGILEGIVAVFAVGFLLKRRPEMVKSLTKIVSVFLVGLGLVLTTTTPAMAQETEPKEAWPGVDKVIVEKTAKEHGQAPADPLIPIEGDALLLAFLLGGGVGGFVLGYQYHKLFVVSEESPNSTNKD